MVKIKVGSQEVYYDGTLSKNLLLARKAVREKDMDFVFLIDGVEGGGKSTLAQQVGKLLDPSLNLSRITFSADEFKEAVLKAKKFQCVVFDEAFGGFASRRSMSKINVTLVDLLAEIRQKNLFIIVVMPTFFDMDKNIALWRSKCLIHIVMKDDFKRGYFWFFNNIKKKYLYLKGKRLYNYKSNPFSFQGRFTSKYVIDEKKYRKKKMDALRAYAEENEDDSKTPGSKWKVQRDKAVRMMSNKYNVPIKVIANEIEEPVSTVYTMVKDK